MNDITIGIIGTGMMGQEHIQNFNLLDGAQVTALADTDAAMLTKAAEMTDGTPIVSDDFETLWAITALMRWLLQRRTSIILTCSTVLLMRANRYYAKSRYAQSGRHAESHAACRSQ